MAGLHGRLRSAGARDRRVVCARDAASGNVRFGVLRKERCTGDPARRLGNDLVFEQLAEANLETLQAVEGRENRFHLPALRAHDFDRLAGVRRSARRSSITVNSGAPHRPIAARPRRAKRSSFTTPAIWAAIAACMTSRAPWSRYGGEVIDPARARERSFCCGAGGGLAFLGEEKGDRVSHTRAPSS